MADNSNNPWGKKPGDGTRNPWGSGPGKSGGPGRGPGGFGGGSGGNVPPDIDEMLRKAQEISPDTVRLMLTGNADQKTAADAVNQGHVFSFLTKPCSPEMMSTVITNALKQYHLIRAEKELLEQTLNGAIKEVRRLSHALRPRVLDDLGLTPALKALSHNFTERTGIEVDFLAMM